MNYTLAKKCFSFLQGHRLVMILQSPLSLNLHLSLNVLRQIRQSLSTCYYGWPIPWPTSIGESHWSFISIPDSCSPQSLFPKSPFSTALFTEANSKSDLVVVVVSGSSRRMSQKSIQGKRRSLGCCQWSKLVSYSGIVSLVILGSMVYTRLDGIFEGL